MRTGELLSNDYTRDLSKLPALIKACAKASTMLNSTAPLLLAQTLKQMSNCIERSCLEHQVRALYPTRCCFQLNWPLDRFAGFEQAVSDQPL